MSKGEWDGTTKLIELSREILEEQHPMTVRQLFYQLVSREALENNQKSYNKVSRIMTKARIDERIDWDWLVDRSRPEYGPSGWDNMPQFLRSMKYQMRKYHRLHWQSQPCYCEIWCEKDATTGSFNDLAEDLGIRVRVCRGYQSTSMAHQVAMELADLPKDKKIQIFYLGDHDGSGRDMEEEVYVRVREYGAPRFTHNRLAIFRADIAKFKLPPVRIKDTDPRTAKFLIKHGPGCVELDALPVLELRKRITDAVVGLRDEKMWQRSLSTEQAELLSLQKLALKLDELKVVEG